MNRGALLKLFILVLIVLGGFFALRESPLARYANYEEFELLINSFGVWAPILFLAAFTFGPIFLAPGMVLTLTGAAVFGVFWGYILIMVGSTLGCMAAFAVGRWGAREFIHDRFGSQPRVVRIQSFLRRNGLLSILFARLLMLPWNLLNYAASITDIRFRDFVLGSVLGQLPITFGLVFLGDTLVQAWREGDFAVLWGARTVFALVILAASVVIPVVILKRRGVTFEE